MIEHKQAELASRKRKQKVAITGNEERKRDVYYLQDNDNIEQQFETKIKNKMFQLINERVNFEFDENEFFIVEGEKIEGKSKSTYTTVEVKYVHLVDNEEVDLGDTGKEKVPLKVAFRINSDTTFNMIKAAAIDYWKLPDIRYTLKTSQDFQSLDLKLDVTADGYFTKFNLTPIVWLFPISNTTNKVINNPTEYIKDETLQNMNEGNVV